LIGFSAHSKDEALSFYGARRTFREAPGEVDWSNRSISYQ